MGNEKKPNVVLIMTDQQRWDTLGCYGNQMIETSNLDQLASEGTVFDCAYSCTPSCIPARASLLTGMNPWHTGVLGMGKGKGNVGTKFPQTMPGELAKAGYHTQGVGKMHFSPQRALNGFHHTVLDESGRMENSDYRRWFEQNKTGDYGFVDHGVDWNSWMARPYHAPEFLHQSNWTANESIRFIEARDPTKPFFLKMSFARPHSPYDPPPFYFDLYARKDLPKAFVGDWAYIHDVEQDAANTNAWRGKKSDEQIQRARAGYYGSIHHIDHQIGRLLAALRQKKQYDNTIFIFLSDHGDMLGDHHLWRKTYAYEGSAHIPMIIKLPDSLGFSVPRRSAQPVCLQDVLPTILDVLDLEIPAPVSGKSLAPILRGRKESVRTYLHGEHSACYSEAQEMHYVTDGKVKYIWFPQLDHEQLFDLEQDPGECCDLSGDMDNRERLLHWRNRMIETLAPRNAGLVRDGQLVCQKGLPPVVSPYLKI